MTTVVVAPDSLKGSCSAADAARAIARGLRASGSDLDVLEFPISDGGEGFLRAFTAAQEVVVRVAGPDGDPVEACYRRQDDLAVIELAQAAGLHLSEARDIQTGTTFGVGALIADAVERGARRILVGLGGSATVDGGLGLLRALGGAFIDNHGRRIETPAALRELRSGSLPTLLASDGTPVELQVAVDVEQQLPGCARSFGPQKGGTPVDIEVMEAALARLVDVVDPDRRHAERTGSGAAGGVGFALSLLGGELRPGIDLVLDALGFDAAIADADLCVTAEGQVDAQSLQGKATVGVARRAAAAGVPCVVVAGSVGRDVDASALPFEVVHLHEGTAPPMAEAKASVIADLERAGSHVALLLGL